MIKRVFLCIGICCTLTASAKAEEFVVEKYLSCHAAIHSATIPFNGKLEQELAEPYYKFHTLVSEDRKFFYLYTAGKVFVVPSSKENKDTKFKIAIGTFEVNQGCPHMSQDGPQYYFRKFKLPNDSRTLFACIADEVKDNCSGGVCPPYTDVDLSPTVPSMLGRKCGSSFKDPDHYLQVENVKQVYPERNGAWLGESRKLLEKQTIDAIERYHTSCSNVAKNIESEIQVAKNKLKEGTANTDAAAINIKSAEILNMIKTLERVKPSCESTLKTYCGNLSGNYFNFPDAFKSASQRISELPAPRFNSLSPEPALPPKSDLISK